MSGRFVLKPFSEGTDGEGRITTGQFGSFVEQGAVAGSSGTLTTDPNTLQGLQSWTTGWTAATEEASMLPRIREMNGVQYVFSKFAIQNHMDGVTYWQAGMGVTANQTVVQYDGKLYLNITGTNTATAPSSDTTNWKFVLDLTKEYVDTTSAQNISGIKTFTSNNVSSGTNINIKNTQFNSTNAPFGDTCFSFDVYDKNNVKYARINSRSPMSDGNTIDLTLDLLDSEGNVISYIATDYDRVRDVGCAKAPTPPLTASGSEVVTANFHKQMTDLPSNSYTALTLGADGATYTAPADGYFALAKRNSSTTRNGYVAMVNITAGELCIENRQVAYGGVGDQPVGRVFMPAKKNDVVRVQYDVTGATLYFRFIRSQNGSH